MPSPDVDMSFIFLELPQVVHYAASQPCPNALYMLATGVDWALEPRALRLRDGLGRGLAHLAVAQGHMAPRASLLEIDEISYHEVIYSHISKHICIYIYVYIYDILLYIWLNLSLVYLSSLPVP